jgi:hypothetical protein
LNKYRISSYDNEIQQEQNHLEKYGLDLAFDEDAIKHFCDLMRNFGLKISESLEKHHVRRDCRLGRVFLKSTKARISAAPFRNA